MVEKSGIKIFLLFQFLMMFSVLPTHISNSVSTDRGALMELYEATGGDQWKKNKGWGSEAPLAEWYGIETNGEGRVTKVDLWKNNLTGNIELMAWDALDKVKYLNLKGNHLTGPMPASLGSMTDLEVLILQGRTFGDDPKEPPEKWFHSYHQGKHYSNTNDFSGQIPAEIGNLSNLIILEISNGKHITGPIPSEIGSLSNLKGLYLSGGDFVGTMIPSSFGNLTNLKHLYIEGAGLVGELPSNFQNLTGLTILNLGPFDRAYEAIPQNSLSGPIPDFSQFTELSHLILSNNKFTGELPHYFNNGNFTQLNVLNLLANNLTGTLFALDNLPNLYGLSLQGNQLTGSIEVLRTAPKKIRIISVGWNNLDGEFPQHGWPDFYQLKTITIGANVISGDIPCSFWKKIDNPKLNMARFGEMPNIDNACLEGAKAMEGTGSIDLTLP